MKNYVVMWNHLYRILTEIYCTIYYYYTVPTFASTVFQPIDIRILSGFKFYKQTSWLLLTSLHVYRLELGVDGQVTSTKTTKGAQKHIDLTDR
jgi:hypothetical protein